MTEQLHTSPDGTRTTRRGWTGPLIWLGLLTAAVISQRLFARAGSGIVTPESVASVRMLLLGATALTLRLIVIFGLPFWLGWRVGHWLVDRASSRARPDQP
ncbi:MAG TPA: hypothetical protein VLC09_07225 [Polyangiaceae bacterium]|nr:hypothetical protein [Polyangiaceae bacterium]